MSHSSGIGIDPNASEDVLIAVMGPTGAGKSSFINVATQSDDKLVESSAEDSCTNTVDAAPPFEHDGRRVILYDTPGFDDSRLTNTQVLQIILKELESQYRKGMTLHGIIYIHPIDQDRVSGQARANFALMQKICGDTTLHNLVLVTNKWSRLSESEHQAKYEKLLSPGSFLAKAITEKKAQLAHNIEHTVDSVRAIVGKIIKNHPLPLLAQTELVDEEKPFGETSAGKESDKLIAELQERFKKEMAEQLEMAEQARRDRDAEMEREMREAAEEHKKDIERLAEERRNADKNYAAMLAAARAEAATAAARAREAAEAAEAAKREFAARAPAPAPAPAPRAPAPRPPRSSPPTLQSITSGKRHTICSVKYDRYVTCEEDERSVSGRGLIGTGRKWIFTKVSSGNWIIESSRYDRYLSTNDNGEIRARSKPEEWKIIHINGEWGQFRLYNTAYQSDMVLSLDDKSVGTPLSLVERRGRRDELWEIDDS